jgi:non-haem Fe2+, alpha-ketoglutarate-dependent halogenase
MSKILSDTEIKNYHRDGFLAPIRVMSADDAAGFRKKFEAYEAAHKGWYEMSKGQKLYLLQTWARDLGRHPKILDAVEDVLGPNLLVWGLSLFIKDANSPSYVSWHQDSTYWGLSKPDVVTAWIALSPANKQSGCMKMMPGTHKWEQIAHKDTLAKENLLTRGQEISVDVDEDKAAYLELEPGEISLHNIRTVHASAPNQSDNRRIGIAIRYIAPHVKQINADGDSAWLVRGVDTEGNFIHETPPEADMDAAAQAEHDRILALRQGVLYKGVAGKPAHTNI